MSTVEAIVFTRPLKRGRRGLTQETKKAAAEKQFGCRLMSTKEAAALYGVGSHQLMNKVRAGLVAKPLRFQNCNYFNRKKLVAGRRSWLKRLLEAA